eukprot:scaffold27731_cov167-Skeletonema_dohrnii-CCMP3373.AAC.1
MSSSLQHSHHQQSNSNDEDDGTTNSHTSFPSSHSWASQHSDGFPSAGSTFFADMTLDLHEAQMETTPRTDTKFASMAAAGSGGRGRIGGPSKEEIMQNVPPMPLIGE